MKISRKTVVWFCTVVLLTSCGSETIPNEESDSKALSKAIDLEEIDVSQFQNPIYLKGEFESWVNENDELVVYTQTDSRKHLFILQGVEENLHINGTIEKLLYLDDFFLITTSEGTASFGADQELIKQIMQRNKISTAIKQFDGFGVVYKWISPENERYAAINPESLKTENNLFHK